MKDITLTIDGKMHKLIDGREPCTKCSLNEICFNNLNPSIACLAISLGGDSFVELKVEK